MNITKNSFPPKTKCEDQVIAMLGILRSVIEGNNNSVYVSIPLTSGKRFLDYYSSNYLEKSKNCNNQDKNFITTLIDSNKNSAKEIVKQLRSRFSETLINPLALPDIEGWEQDDYRDFWGRVVERYAKTVICTKDWNYSSGCIYEFLIAKQNNIQTTDENSAFISIQEGINLIKKAVGEMKNSKMPSHFLENVINSLTKIKVEENYATDSFSTNQ